MVRNSPGPLVARLIAVCLLALAASVITAASHLVGPSDFGHTPPASTSQHAPAREVVEALVRVGPTFVVTALTPTPAKVGVVRDIPTIAVRQSTRVDQQRTSRAVLRL